MALMDDIRERANSVVSIAGKKANEAYGATKTKMLIAEKKNYLRTLYKELGEITYRGYKDSEQDMNAIEDKIAEIDIAAEALEDLKKELRKIKNIIICPSCRAEIEADVNFCPRCGEDINTFVDESDE